MGTIWWNIGLIWSEREGPDPDYRGLVPNQSNAQPADHAHEAPTFWGRRVGAIIIDWLASLSVSFVFFPDSALATLLIFAGSTFLLQATLGTTIGHWVVGVGTRTAEGRMPGLARAAVRTLALCLVVPPVVVDAHGRGLHERWSQTHIVALRQHR